MKIIQIQENYQDIIYLNDLELLWRECIEKNYNPIFIDCLKIESITSMLIGEFVKLLNETKINNIQLYLFNTNSSVKKVLETCRLDEYFKILSKEEFQKIYFSDDWRNK